MKLILISIAAFLIFTAPVFSELTVEALEKIRTIVNESEARMKEYVEASENPYERICRYKNTRGP